MQKMNQLDLRNKLINSIPRLTVLHVGMLAELFPEGRPHLHPQNPGEVIKKIREKMNELENRRAAEAAEAREKSLSHHNEEYFQKMRKAYLSIIEAAEKLREEQKEREEREQQERQ